MTYYVRFCQNNLAAAANTLTVSSAASNCPGSNSVSTQRYKKWQTTGAFTVTASNKVIYINDGANVTVNLTTATYTTGALLAAHIQTQLNASSTNWTCTYSSGYFTIGRSSGTATLRLTQTTNAAWSMLGYTGAADVSAGTGLLADARRNHTSETWVVDFNVAKTPTCFFAFGMPDADFGVSDVATVTLKGNSTSDFTSPGITINLTASTAGIFYFFDGLSTTYRFWQFEFSDKTNTAGPAVDFSYIYLGDYVTFTTRNLSEGFTRKLVDPSILQESENGGAFWRRRSKYWLYESLSVEWLSDTERTNVEGVFTEVGTSTPFVLSVDPGAAISASVGEFTKFGVFASDPTIKHLRYKYYTVDFAFREITG